MPYRIQLHPVNLYICVTGTNCEVNIDDCIGVSCTVPNTECIDMVNGYLCKCKPGFQGGWKSILECLNYPKTRKKCYKNFMSPAD